MRARGHMRYAGAYASTVYTPRAQCSVPARAAAAHVESVRHVVTRLCQRRRPPERAARERQDAVQSSAYACSGKREDTGKRRLYELHAIERADCGKETVKWEFVIED